MTPAALVVQTRLKTTLVKHWVLVTTLVVQLRVIHPLGLLDSTDRLPLTCADRPRMLPGVCARLGKAELARDAAIIARIAIRFMRLSFLPFLWLFLLV